MHPCFWRCGSTRPRLGLNGDVTDQGWRILGAINGTNQETNVLNGLRNYYITTGISAERFRCPMAPSCRAVCVDFISAREAFVGSEYERGTLPRVLFVSLDAAKDLSDR